MPYMPILIVHYLLFSGVIVFLGPHLCCYVVVIFVICNSVILCQNMWQVTWYGGEQ